MDIFTQNKNLIRTVILLVLLNLILIFFLVWKEVTRRPEGSRGPELFPKNEEFRDVSGILKEKLNLSDIQASHIQKIRDDFYEKEKIIALTVRNKKDSMNVAMFNERTDEKQVQRLAKEITEYSYQMQLLRIEQAKKLKAVCTPEQQRKMKEMVVEIRDYFRPDNQPKK